MKPERKHHAETPTEASHDLPPDHPRTVAKKNGRRVPQGRLHRVPTLVRDIKAVSPDGEIRNRLIEDIAAEGWLRWTDGARLPASSRGGGHLKIQMWTDKKILAMAQDVQRAAKADGGTSTLSATMRRLLILGLEAKR